MIFLIHYDRRRGTLHKLNEFSDNNRKSAESTRLRWELRQSTLSSNDEIVLLEASSLAQLRRTHGRYFFSAKDLLKMAAEEATTASTKAPENSGQN